MTLLMTCQDYIFKLSSGQLDEAGRLDSLRASHHRLVCRRCRAFTRNNARLDDILADYKEKLTKPDEPSQIP